MEHRAPQRTALICLIVVAYINGEDKVCSDRDPTCTQIMPPCNDENNAQLCPKACDLCNTSLPTNSVATDNKMCSGLIHVDCYKDVNLIKRCPEYCTSTFISKISTRVTATGKSKHSANDIFIENGSSTDAEPESTTGTRDIERTTWLYVMIIIPMIILTVIYAVKKKRECHGQQPSDMLSLLRSRLATTCTVRTFTSDSDSQTSSAGQSQSGHGRWSSERKIFDRIVQNNSSSEENVKKDDKEKEQMTTASAPPEESVDHVELVYAKVDFTQVQMISYQSSAKVEPTEYSAIDFQECAK